MSRRDLIRFGLTGVAAFWFVHRLLLLFPTAVDPATWYVGVSIFTLLTILALAVYGCCVAVIGSSRLAASRVNRRIHATKPLG